MTILHSLILGLVEGLTEFLPISSTGHLIIAGKLLGLPGGEFEKSFDIVIQLGAIAAVVVYYFRSFWGKKNIELWKKLIVAFIPTGILGLLLHGLIKQYLLGNSLVVITALFLGGIFIIWFERSRFGRREETEAALDPTKISYKQSLLIGLAQSLAMIPGISRSAATIIGGQALGLSRRAIVEFSFLLAVPTMLAATGYDLLKSYQEFSLADFGLLTTGFLAAFITAWLVIKWLLAYIQRHDFAAFGWYRVLAAIIFALIIVL
jgi:undecaprenyl-diphosphatase